TGLLGLAFLIGDDTLRRIPPTLVGRLSKVGLGLLDGHLRDTGVQLGLRGEEFGVQFWRINHRKRLAGSHAIPDIDEPFGDITVHPRIDRAITPGSSLSRKTQRLLSARRSHGKYIYGGRFCGVAGRGRCQPGLSFAFLAIYKEE